MNLADAIRQAAYAGGPVVPEQAAYAPQPAPAPQPTVEPRAKKTTKKGQAPEQPAANEHPWTGQTTMMRMELFLTPEQLSALFRSVVATQHTVLTLREAASHLRINPHSLEQMAANGEVAAFMVDGRWRFPKSGLDEWVSLNTFRKEDADAA